MHMLTRKAPESVAGNPDLYEHWVQTATREAGPQCLWTRSRIGNSLVACTAVVTRAPHPKTRSKQLAGRSGRRTQLNYRRHRGITPE